MLMMAWDACQPRPLSRVAARETSPGDARAMRAARLLGQAADIDELRTWEGGARPRTTLVGFLCFEGPLSLL